MVRPEGESMKINKTIIKNNLKLTARAFHKQWSVFYRSKYGKVGFYIMLAFIVVALLSPAIVHGSPFSAIPSEDYFTPIQELNTSLQVTPDHSAYNLTSTLGQHSKDYYIFMAGSNKSTNAVYAISAKNGSSSILFTTDGTIVSIKAFTPVSSYYLTQTYVLAATNNTIYVGDVTCTPTTNGATVSATLVKDKSDNNIIGAFSSTGTYSTSRPNIYTDQEIRDTNVSYASYIYTFSHNGTGYYLNAYLTANLNHQWSKKLDYSPVDLYFIGNQFGPSSHKDSRIIVTGAYNITSFYENGTKIYSDNFTSPVTSLYIPSSYQTSDLGSGYNIAFMSSGNYLYEINLKSGNETEIYAANATITAVGTSEGSHGFPGVVLVATSHYISALQESKGNISVFNTIKMQFTVNTITRYSTADAFLLSNTTSGDFIYLIDPSCPAVDAFSWHISQNKAISTPDIFINPYDLNSTGDVQPAIGVIENSHLVFYSVEGNAEVLGPTLHTYSGISLPFGTNIAHEDEWMIFIDSFTPDLEVGFGAGIITILISVVVAMYIGYSRGLASSFIETMSLSIFLIPTLPLFIVLATVLGPTLINLILIFSLLGWPFVTFSLIGIVRSVKSRTFIDSAVVSNLGTLQIMKRHILPNMGTLLAYLTAINIGGAVAAVSTYEILGLAPLTIPTWGGMLSGFLSNYFILSTEPWVVIPALVALTLFILAFIFIARGIDEVANPTLGDR
jgi:peptide/nickel transport system permease protein